MNSCSSNCYGLDIKLAVILKCKELQEASTHKSVVIHADNVFAADLLRKLHSRRNRQSAAASAAGKLHCENPVLLAWLVQRTIAPGKTQHGLCRQQQYCVLFENQHRLVVSYDLDL